MGEVGQRFGELVLAPHVALLERLPLRQERGGEARRVLQVIALCGARLAGGHGRALAGEADCVPQEVGQRQAAAPCAGEFERLRPARDRARHGERGQRAVRRNRLLVPILEIAADCRLRPGGAECLEAADLAAGLANEPQAVAAQPGPLGVDDRKRRRHGDRRLQRVAALGEDGLARRGCRLVGRGERGEGEFGRRGHGRGHDRGHGACLLGAAGAGLRKLAGGPPLIYVLVRAPHRGVRIVRRSPGTGESLGGEKVHQLAERHHRVQRRHSGRHGADRHDVGCGVGAGRAFSTCRASSASASRSSACCLASTGSTISCARR